MTDARFVHIVDDVPELAGDADAPAMIVALEGFLDAGNAASIAVESMLDDDRGRVVASFEVDEFYDYRARRPPITFSENHYTDYEAPRLVVRLLKDAAESPYLLLSGPEPDIRWEAFCGAVRAVVNTLGVREVWSLSAVPIVSRNRATAWLPEKVVRAMTSMTPVLASPPPWAGRPPGTELGPAAAELPTNRLSRSSPTRPPSTASPPPVAGPTKDADGSSPTVLASNRR